MKEKVVHIEMHLNNPDELFIRQPVNPLKQKELRISGVDQLYHELRVLDLKETVKLILYLPAISLPSEAGKEIREALTNYCNYEIETIRNDYEMLKWEGYSSLRKGIIFLSICILLASVINKQEFLPEFIRSFLREGLFIIGWVSMWKPVEILLYEWVPYRRKLKIYEFMKCIGVEVTSGLQDDRT